MLVVTTSIEGMCLTHSPHATSIDIERESERGEEERERERERE